MSSNFPVSAQGSIRSQIVERRTYLRPLNDDGTIFETFEESIDRVIDHQRWLWERAKAGMMKDSAGQWELEPLSEMQESELDELRALLLQRKVTVAGRTRWLGGTSIAKKRESSNFNCSFLEVRSVYDVVDILWLLLQGCGVGFRPVVGSLNGFNKEIPELEIIRTKRTAKGGKETNTETFDRETGVWTIKVGDSAEAWAKSIGKILAGKRTASKLVLDFSEIRPAGDRLRGYGWISSGDEQIAKAYEAIFRILNNAAGRLLTRIEILDIVNWLGTVLSSRRSAEIALFEVGEPEWQDFTAAKKDWWDFYDRDGNKFVFPEGMYDKEERKDLAESQGFYSREHRQQSNNTLVFNHRPERHELENIFEIITAAGGSEPGFLNGVEAKKRAPWFKGVNPCAEILLGDRSFCNLVETVLFRFNGDPAGLSRAHYIISRANYRQTCVWLDDGILQRGWHELNEYLHLCGVGVTGVVSWDSWNDAKSWETLRDAAHLGANSMADELGMPRAKAITTIKPSGCLPLDATILTADGLLTVAEIMENHKEGDLWTETDLVTIQGSGSRVRASKTYDNGVAEVFKIETTYNLPIRSTADHKWLLESGEWCETKNLKIGDAIVVSPGLYDKTEPYQFDTLSKWRLRPNGKRGTDIIQPREMTSELSWLIGYLFGDGSMSPNRKRFRFSDNNKSNLDRVKEIVGDVFGISVPEPTKMNDRNAWSLEFGNSALWEWFHFNKLEKNLDYGVPKVIRTGSREHSIAFIAGLIDSDGCYHENNRNVIFTQSDEYFVSSFQQLAWSVGLAFGRSHNTAGVNLQEHKDIYLCTLSSHSIQESVDVLFSLSLKLAGKEQKSHNRKFSVKVKAVESVGLHETADIEVPGIHRYIAYGAVESHNTQSKTLSLPGQEVPEGIHSPLGRFIFNNVGMSKHDPLVEKLISAGYYIFDHPTDSTAVLVRIPVEYSNIKFDKFVKKDSKGNDIVVEVNTETAIEQLDRYKITMNHYTDHNSSITVSYDVDEIPGIIDWFMENWDNFVGVSFLYRNDPTKTAEDLGYAYLPQEVVDEKTFRAYTATIRDIDWTGTESELSVENAGETCVSGCPIR